MPSDLGRGPEAGKLKNSPVFSNIWGRTGRFFIKLVIRRLNQTAWIGRVLILAFRDLRGNANRRRLVWSQILLQIARTFQTAIYPVILLGFLTGVLWTVIWYALLRNIGGVESFVSVLVTVQFQEVSPFLTFMVALAAYMGPMILEIILMKTNGQFDNLIMMGIPPAHVVAWPRVIGPVLAFPLLLVVTNVCVLTGALIGSWFAVRAPVTDFVYEIYLKIKVFKLFKLLLQGVLMAFTMGFFSLYSAWTYDSRDLSLAPRALRRGIIEAAVVSALVGVLVTVFYA
ncbi:MAG: ABC transporter permease [Deltaproteobacteria bacterium]|nr:ABC transporter permease [Deltaproteobacteria bacterium]